MSSINTDLRPAGNPLGNLLRHWRTVRGRNQLDLSLETGISQRHISFVESGRSTPSRQTLLEIAQVLDVPLRERNALLLSAGFAPVYSEAACNSAQMHSVIKALERVLRQHEPFPALVMDRYWNVLMTNESAPRFFNCFFDMSQRKGPRQALHVADRTSEALEAIREAETLAERFEQRYWSAELHRLRGLFLAAVGADDTQIEASFCAAISTANEQKSVSLATRAEATYAEYRRQKASASGGRGFRLPLW